MGTFLDLLSADPGPALDRLAASPFRARQRLAARDLACAERKGARLLREHALALLAPRIGELAAGDGRQTPWRGHPVFTAQHATALCCRGCMARWWGVPPARPLTRAELEAAAGIVVAWIERQVAQEAQKRQKERKAR
ncbi:MAG: DUF4186 family protein, partial [Duodenibacillus sp.]|nr:DUF4186 family protein [Duodenibacillus sp.]